MIELNKIYNMDCVEGMKQIDESVIDLIVTSPPYNVGIQYDSWDDLMPWADYLDWCRRWLTECFRVLKDDGRICVNHMIQINPVKSKENHVRFPIFDLMNIMNQIGYQVKFLSVWDDLTIPKQTAWGSWKSASSPYLSSPYEGVIIACKKYWTKLSKGESTISKEDFMEGCSGVWHIGTTTGLTMANFPEKLPQLCIDLFSYKGDTVLDPFSGSGTTCYVAKGLERKYIGFEISEAYYNASLSRLLGAPYKVVPNTNPYGRKEISKETLW